MEQLRELVPWVYFLAAVTFVLGLKGLSGPTTAPLGNRVAAGGMLLAVIATFLESQVASAWILIVPAIAIGTVIGFVGARRVPMTAMPQMVALFNGAGGGAAAVVALSEFLVSVKDLPSGAPLLPLVPMIATLLGAVIGGVSLTGSIVAFGKLQGFIPARPVSYPGQRIVAGLLLGGLVVIGILLARRTNSVPRLLR